MAIVCRPASCSVPVHPVACQFTAWFEPKPWISRTGGPSPATTYEISTPSDEKRSTTNPLHCDATDPTQSFLRRLWFGRFIAHEIGKHGRSRYPTLPERRR